MRILHYSLGFPPYRSGGLTKFCMDLMREQFEEGHKVGLLWPGEIRFLDRRVTIRKGKSVDGITSYELINPLPVPFDEGIKDFDAFIQEGDKEIYDEFLSLIEPDIIHVHTFMGLHKNLLVVAKEKGIRLIFTTHDFFPICSKVTMFRQGRICDSVISCETCGVCNNTALSLRKMQVLQSPTYRKLKDSMLVKSIRKQHRDNYLGNNYNYDDKSLAGTSMEYKRLRDHYYDMLLLMDIVHFNSTVTKMAYDKVFDLPNNCVIGITHADIFDNRREKSFLSNKLRIRFLGPQGGGKGFFLLRTALDELWKQRQDFCLDVHFTPMETSPYINSHKRYNYNELEQIFDETDVLVVPSIWYETFGYTVVEALSYGVPVVISGTVGAKDSLVDGAGIVIDEIDSNKIYDVINQLNVEKLKAMNRTIIHNQHIMTMHEMAGKIMEECYMEA